MTTLKDYKEKVMREHREKFIQSIKSQGEYCHFFGEDTGDLDTVTLDGNFSFDFVTEDLSLAIDNAVAEAFKAVEVEKKEITVIQVSSDGSKSEYMEPDVSFNEALQEVEVLKKQYLV
jgi:hypothetical protein